MMLLLILKISMLGLWNTMGGGINCKSLLGNIICVNGRRTKLDLKVVIAMKNRKRKNMRMGCQFNMMRIRSKRIMIK